MESRGKKGEDELEVHRTMTAQQARSIHAILWFLM